VTTLTPITPWSADGFRHKALLYAGDAEFNAGTTSFIRRARIADEPIMVAVTRDKCDRLRARLGADARRVRFADMAEVGANPARIIPAWQAFVDECAGKGRRLWGIGEPIWAERTAAELAECQRHESLLNVAFAGAPAFELLCPYDTSTLDPAVIDKVHRSHPFIVHGADEFTSSIYAGIDPASDGFDAPLPQPPSGYTELSFTAKSLDGVRGVVRRHAAEGGLSAQRMADLVLAVTEVASNSLRWGGGGGTLRVWQESNGLACEIRDAGHVMPSLVGRERPGPGAEKPRGLWLVNQLCDLVQLRSSATGTAVRLFLRAA
jgi:anti-sigma regulatory factor (Ser/Thr protein kinase)